MRYTKLKILLILGAGHTSSCDNLRSSYDKWSQAIASVRKLNVRDVVRLPGWSCVIASERASENRVLNMFKNLAAIKVVAKKWQAFSACSVISDTFRFFVSFSNSSPSGPRLDWTETSSSSCRQLLLRPAVQASPVSWVFLETYLNFTLRVWACNIYERPLW